MNIYLEGRQESLKDPPQQTESLFTQLKFTSNELRQTINTDLLNRTQLSSISFLPDLQLKGALESSDSQAIKVAASKPPAHQDVRFFEEQRQHLSDAAQRLVHSGKMTEKQYESFTKDMNAFEERARKDGLSAKEVGNCYQQISRILENGDPHHPPRVHRNMLAVQCLAHAARPDQIDQGNHNTCNVTTLEERIFARHPARAMEIVAGIALHGTWTGPDGKVAKVNPASCKPGGEEKQVDDRLMPQDGDRSYASQLFQLAVINHFDAGNRPNEAYRQDPPKNDKDTGERRVKDGKVVDSQPSLGADDIQKEGSALVRDLDDKTNPQERRFVLSRDNLGDGSDDPVQVKNKHDLVYRLEQIKSHGRLPAIVVVDANDPMFRAPGEAPADKPQWHVISVRDLRKKPDGHYEIDISNQWGSAWDKKSISAGQLYSAMNEYKPPTG